MVKICIDAGHYGKYNRSPANKAYYESEAMWKLHLFLKKYLERYGFEVIVTRKDQAKDLSITSRGKKSKGCDLFLSLHSNATGSGISETTDRVCVYHLTDDTTTKCDDVSKEIAEKIAPVIADVMGTIQKYRVLSKKSKNDRNKDGIFNDNYYGVLHGSRTVGTPGLILEHSFHTNTRSTNWLLNESNLDKLASCEAEVIAEYFNVGSDVTEKPIETTQTIKSLSGIVKVIYEGSDGLNVRSAPCMGDNVREVVHGGTYTVVGISEDGKWYKLKSGGFISANDKYVRFTKVTEYYEKYTGKSIHVDVVFKEIGVPEKFRGNWGARKPIATENGIENYNGKAGQNSRLISLAKQGKLKKVQ